MMVDLSVIIVSFNTKKLTTNAVKSVLNDSSAENKEIIVIDNASTDGSVEAIKSLKNKKVKVIANDENFGFSIANNQGIKIAKGKYVLLLNSDTVVKKGSLKKLIEFAESKEDCGVVGARLLNADGTLQDSCFNLPTIPRAIMQHWLKLGKPLDKFAPKGNEPCEVESVVGAVMLITPSAIKRVGGLNEKYPFYYEDLDYCRSVRKAGLKVYYLPSVEVVHYHGASGANLKKSQDQWRRLIPSSKVYHGNLGHFIFNSILWSGQKFYSFSIYNLLRRVVDLSK